MNDGPIQPVFRIGQDLGSTPFLLIPLRLFKWNKPPVRSSNM